MPKAISDDLTADHVLRALVDLDAGIEHPFGLPTGYELVHTGNAIRPRPSLGWL